MWQRFIMSANRQTISAVQVQINTLQVPQALTLLVRQTYVTAAARQCWHKFYTTMISVLLPTYDYLLLLLQTHFSAVSGCNWSKLQSVWKETYIRVQSTITCAAVTMVLCPLLYRLKLTQFAADRLCGSKIDETGSKVHR